MFARMIGVWCGVVIMEPVNVNWTNSDGTHDGGVSYGQGYCIHWQRGPLSQVEKEPSKRNGAFLIEVLESCRHQLNYFQDTFLPCEENKVAIQHIDSALEALHQRRDRRKASGVLGSTKEV